MQTLFASAELPVTVYDKNPAGRLLTRVTNDIASLGRDVLGRIRVDDRKRADGSGDPDLADRPGRQAGADRGKRVADSDRFVRLFQLETSRFLPRSAKQAFGAERFSRRESSRHESRPSFQSAETASGAI